MALTIRPTDDPEEALFQVEEQLRASGMAPLSQQELRQLAIGLQGDGNIQKQGFEEEIPEFRNAFRPNPPPIQFGQGPEIQMPGAPGGMFRQSPVPQQGQYDTTFTLGPDRNLKRLIINRLKNRTTEV